jgi:hypothetical protein
MRVIRHPTKMASFRSRSLKREHRVMKLATLIIAVALGSAATAAFAEPAASQPPAQASPSTGQGDWYYCSDNDTYYPFVLRCPGGWKSVPAGPQVYQYVVPR